MQKRSFDADREYIFKCSAVNPPQLYACSYLMLIEYILVSSTHTRLAQNPMAGSFVVRTYEGGTVAVTTSAVQNRHARVVHTLC
jgi:hypothetical protein